MQGSNAVSHLQAPDSKSHCSGPLPTTGCQKWGSLKIRLCGVQPSTPHACISSVRVSFTPLFEKPSPMEPLSALAVASAVVQMVDFGAKLFSKSVELYKSAEGSLPINVELSSIVEDLSQISDGLVASHGLKEEQLTEDEVALIRLASQCNSLAHELMSDLQRLVVQNPDRKIFTRPKSD